jgi:hypothetical protein
LFFYNNISANVNGYEMPPAGNDPGGDAGLFSGHIIFPSVIIMIEGNAGLLSFRHLQIQDRP